MLAVYLPRILSPQFTLRRKRSTDISYPLEPRSINRKYSPPEAWQAIIDPTQKIVTSCLHAKTSVPIHRKHRALLPYFKTSKKGYLIHQLPRHRPSRLITAPAVSQNKGRELLYSASQPVSSPRSVQVLTSRFRSTVRSSTFNILELYFLIRNSTKGDSREKKRKYDESSF